MIACVAVVGETLADVLEPWPVKVIVDSVHAIEAVEGAGSAKPPSESFGDNALAVLNFAVAAVVVIAVIGAISSRGELPHQQREPVGEAHDLRRTLYHHIQRLSLSEHNESRTGDLISRVTKDTDAVRSSSTPRSSGSSSTC